MLRFQRRIKPEDKIGVYEYTRHVFGAKSSPTCTNYPFSQASVDNQVDHPKAAKAIEKNFYMDDFAKSVTTVEKQSMSTKMLEQPFKKEGSIC